MKISVLGSAGARSYRDRDNTFLGVESDGVSLFIDCGGSPVQKAEQIRFPWRNSEGVIITHLHPDHFYGLPSLIHNLRLIERTRPFTVWCAESNREKIKQFLDFFKFNEAYSVPVVIKSPCLELFERLMLSDLSITLFPTEHGITSVGVYIEDAKTGKKMLYSSDTRPCENTLKFSHEVDLLIHEASFLNDQLPLAQLTNHSTAREAAELAAAARVRKLLLLHCYAEEGTELSDFLDEAKEYFYGEVEVARDLSQYIV